MTAEFSEQEKHKTAIKVSLAVLISCFTMFFFGKYIFNLFGITLDAFRIGAGTVLFLSALSLINGAKSVGEPQDNVDIAVVPLAIPITVGPGVIGVLMVMGAEMSSATEQLIVSFSLIAAVLTIGVMLWVSGWMQRFLGEQVLAILPKVTGLFVSAIAAQIIFTGVKNFLFT